MREGTGEGSEWSDGFAQNCKEKHSQEEHLPVHGTYSAGSRVCVHCSGQVICDGVALCDKVATLLQQTGTMYVQLYHATASR